MNAQIINIGSKIISNSTPCFIVAEAGSNHDGKLTQAKELIDVAINAGADAVKFQVFKGRENALPRDWLPELADYCRQNSIIFLATPADIEAIDILEPLVVAYKWASLNINNLPYLRYAASKGKPMIISTGASTLDEVEEAIEVVNSTGNNDIILLHCTSIYPARPDQINLRVMDTLSKYNLLVGFSDHTTGIVASISAVVKGACLIEKHFTLSKTLKGPDHNFSMEPNELSQLVRVIREVELCLGSGEKIMLPEEAELARIGRKSIIALVKISKDTKISEEMVTIDRPGYGIEPKFLNSIIGRISNYDIQQNGIITWEMLR